MSKPSRQDANRNSMSLRRVDMQEVVVVINPGSTSTKVAVYTREGALAEENVKHPADELQKFDMVTEQYETRLTAIREFLESTLKDDYKVVAIAGRGAPLKPLVGGTYKVNDALLEDVRS